MIKRTADWLEKMSAGAMLIGMFQINATAIAIGTFFYFFSLYLTNRSLS